MGSDLRTYVGAYVDLKLKHDSPSHVGVDDILGEEFEECFLFDDYEDTPEGSEAHSGYYLVSNSWDGDETNVTIPDEGITIEITNSLRAKCLSHFIAKFADPICKLQKSECVESAQVKFGLVQWWS